jgi:alanyl-tRNA synthetase
LIKEKLKEEGIDINIPENFYSYVSEIHESKGKEKTSTKKELDFDIPSLPETEKLYIKDYLETEFQAKILWTKDDYVVLDRTAFYPTSGGQMHDTGKLIDSDNNEHKVKEVIKHNRLVVHKIESKAGKVKLKEDDKVKGEINKERRIQLSQHHTAAHIVNGAARRILGDHIWQAGAAKSLKKARLDITHYEALSEDEIRKIEELANKIIKENRKVNNYILERGEAERRFGFRIYQGGAVPGVELRIVEIKDFDVEACGGTHLNSTGEAESIKILKSTKIQDGVARIEFAAGKAAKDKVEKENKIVKELEKLLGCDKQEIIGRVEELFKKWKKVRKAVKKKREIEKEWLSLKSQEKTNKNNEEILKESAETLSTQPEHLCNTVSRFLKDLEEARKRLKD